MATPQELRAEHYAALRFETPQRRLASAILGNLQLKFVESKGAPGGFIFYFGVCTTRSKWADDPARLLLQQQRAVYTHMKRRSADRKDRFPGDWLNKQQSGKFGRRCLTAAMGAFLARGKPGTSADAPGVADIFAIAQSDLSKPYSGGSPADYLFYGIAMKAAEHDGCCTGDYVGSGDYCHEWMKDGDTRYGLEASYFGTTWTW